MVVCPTWLVMPLESVSGGALAQVELSCATDARTVPLVN